MLHITSLIGYLVTWLAGYKIKIQDKTLEHVLECLWIKVGVRFIEPVSDGMNSILTDEKIN